MKEAMSLMCPRLTRTAGWKTLQYIVLHLKIMRWGEGNSIGLCGQALCQGGKYLVLIFSLLEPLQRDDCQCPVTFDTMSNPRRFRIGYT